MTNIIFQNYIGKYSHYTVLVRTYSYSLCHHCLENGMWTIIIIIIIINFTS